MSFNFSDGFLFAVGWFVAKVAIHFAVGFISELLYRLWPWYKGRPCVEHREDCD